MSVTGKIMIVVGGVFLSIALFITLIQWVGAIATFGIFGVALIGGGDQLCRRSENKPREALKRTSP